MRISPIATLGFTPAGIWAQDVFEPPNFNVTQALLDHGVNVSVIPDVAGLAGRSLSSGCSLACKSLNLTFGNTKVEYQGDPAYDAVIRYFWSSQQQEPKPHCVFKPEKAADVSIVVLLSRLTQCRFAVRSGGHAAFAGASSADGGITVSFEKMKQISLSEDKKVASIEPGNLWFDIYTTLDKDHLAVVGGRVSGIGIGGLTTGGGISYFTNQYGWACDNVASFDIVTASGLIVNASPSSHPDLYWALRGGGNNLGIVTNFNLRTFAHGPQMFGGQRRFFNASFPAAINAFVNLGVNAADDPKAAQFLAITMNAASGTKVAIAELEYADPVLDAPIFEEYRNIPAFADTTKLDTLAYFTQQLNNSNPKGYRETFWTASSKLDREMVEFVFNASFDEFAKLRDVAGIIPANTLQIISVPTLKQMQKNGGNTLGLTPSDGPVFLINLSTRWDKKEDDARVLRANANIVQKMLDEAKRRNMVNDFLYMNYASQFQDVIGSYGEDSHRLRHVARQYDPTEVFQRLQPGYFKLNGAPDKKWLQ
ncbi:FAD-binding domain-containing protein [Cucurbitaria berberidis CBS 394.84]|uniref:FAD-binding domain-containing protein n=1 Tax=Cucurbitaria berberidis CBS 394.84 TaxID=1168544 RepID=A0A9P4GJZ6_9PLEO|nr:FAD-binding domain-containing protein [Cucurbitaria berberidis CBS 394.84]KAF1847683.1 FAD-binding domain-containing protein [Cucurbitaria berberidis CBS 394.84]